MRILRFLFLQMNTLEAENISLRREVFEKGELIEHWIRTRKETVTTSESPKHTVQGSFFLIVV